MSNNSFYHFESSRANVNKDEPVYTNLFRVSFVLPPPLRPIYGTEMLVQQIKSIEGLDLDKIPEVKTQMYRFTPRHYAEASVKEAASISPTMKFEVNIDGNSKIMYPYAEIKSWGRLQYDPSNAAMALKKDYSGSCVIEVFMKDGTVIRRIECPTMFLKENLKGWSLEYKESGIYELEAKFIAENVKDFTILPKK